MKFVEGDGLTFDDVLLVPRYNEIESRKDVSLATKLVKGGPNLDAPILSANMNTVTESEMMIALSDLGCAGVMHRFMDVDKAEVELCTFARDAAPGSMVIASLGVNGDAKDLLSLYERLGFVDVVCIDVAHGHSLQVLNMIEAVKNLTGCKVIAGNVATPSATRALIEAGADAVKVGIGPGCFAAGTRIMMSNGTYKNIEDIRAGDRVINKYGYPVTVKGAIKTGYRLISQVRNNVFYKPTMVTSDHQYWVGDMSSVSQKYLSSKGYVKVISTQSKTTPKRNKIKWMKIGDLKRGCLLMPRHIKFEMPDTFRHDIRKRCGGNGHSEETTKYKVHSILVPSYDLGYIFGTFLGDGTSCVMYNKKRSSWSGTVSWAFGENEQNIADKLSACIRNVFGKNAVARKRNDKAVLGVFLYSKPLADFFQLWGKGADKHIPDEFMCSDMEYAQGMLDGLIDSDGCNTDGVNNFKNTSERLIELYSVYHYLVHGYFPSITRSEPSVGGLDGCNIDNCHPSFCARSLKRPDFRLTDYNQIVRKTDFHDTGIYCDVYDLEVDCPTHSFIAENAIVHNSLCTTRLVTGCGVPQLSAIIECSDVANDYDVPIIADGGLRNSGDVVKALAAGASTVMSGSFFSGTKETPGELVEHHGRKYKRYQGMASADAMIGWKGPGYHAAPEGESTLVSYKGSVEKVVKSILAGIRSGLTYHGAYNLEELRENAVFRRISPNCLIENKPHGK